MTAVIEVAVLAVLFSAWAFHAVADHHVHLRLLARVRPGTAVPATRHDTWWHALPRRRRAAVNAALITCAALFGAAWTVQPGATAVIAVLAVLTAALILALRALRRGRHPGPGGS